MVHPKDEVTHCLFCDTPLCVDCEVGGLCSNCAQVVEDEEDLEAEEGFWKVQVYILNISVTSPSTSFTLISRPKALNSFL